MESKSQFRYLLTRANKNNIPNVDEVLSDLNHVIWFSGYVPIVRIKRSWFKLLLLHSCLDGFLKSKSASVIRKLKDLQNTITAILTVLPKPVLTIIFLYDKGRPEPPEKGAVILIISLQICRQKLVLGTGKGQLC